MSSPFAAMDIGRTGMGFSSYWLDVIAHNLANVGRFSSDRTIRDYAREIWNVEPVSIEIGKYDSTNYVKP